MYSILQDKNSKVGNPDIRYSDRGLAVILEENMKMENKVINFENEEFGCVRSVEVNGKTYFVGSDITKALGYSIPHKAIQPHCKGVSEMDIPTNGGIQKVKIIPEGDIYRLVVKSQLPDADKFESWILVVSA